MLCERKTEGHCDASNTFCDFQCSLFGLLTALLLRSKPMLLQFLCKRSNCNVMLVLKFPFENYLLQRLWRRPLFLQSKLKSLCS